MHNVTLNIKGAQEKLKKVSIKSTQITKLKSLFLYFI